MRTASWWRADRHGNHPRLGRHRRLRSRSACCRCPDRRREDRRRSRPRPGGVDGRERRPRDRCDRQVRRSRRRRRPHAHATPVRWHRGIGHLRDRHPRRRVGRRHDDRRLRRPEDRRERQREPRRLAREGGGRVRHRLRLPPDHRWCRRGVVEGDDVSRRQRGRHQLQDVHGVSRASSTPTTARSCGPCRTPPRAAR